MAFHIFHLSEAYTNADGTLQFIEFHGEANSQNLWANRTITATQGGVTHTYNITQNLPSPTTLNKNVLVATQAFADLTGITPDYIIPANFLFTSGVQTINFPGMDNLAGVMLPTDGLQSLDEDGLVQNADPHNFAGTGLTSAAKPFTADPIADQVAGNADGFVFAFPAGTFVDLTGDALTYTAESMPGFLAFDPGTRTFSFAAGTGVPGTYEVEVRAADTLSGALGAASDIFTLTVISGDVVVGTDGNDSLLSGTADEDHISGLAGDDSLVGGGGDDSMLGGLGNDTFAVDSLDDVVTELTGAGQGDFDRIVTTVSLPTLAANVEQLALGGADNLTAVGNGLANVLIGNTGHNELDGAGANDMLVGEGGNDTYNNVEAGDTIVEGEAGGIDLVRTSAQLGVLAEEVEGLTLLGVGNLNATGNGSANTLTGNDGNNVLNGGGGPDEMIGGLGNDTYQVDDIGDNVTETGAGTDLVLSAVSFSLAVGQGDVLVGDVERLTLTGGGNIDGTGNALANVITGNAGNNVLDGAGGDDSLNGGVGNDTLDGSAGNDTLKGGTGADVFLFEDGSGTDKLPDFQSGIDKIWLDNEVFTSLVDGPLGAGNAQFGLHGAISDTSGDGDDYVKFATDTGELYYDANGSTAGGLTLIAVIDPSCGATLPQLALADIVVV